MKIKVIADKCFQNYKSISVEITANWKTEEIAVKQLGSNSSAIDGIELQKGREVRLQLTSTLHILAGLYPQKVEVTKQTSPKREKKEDTRTPCSSSTEKNKKKRAADTDINTNTKKLSPPSKRQKMEKDDSESDEDEHIKSVEEKLKLLKKLKKHHVKEEKKEESPEKIPEQSNIKQNGNETKKFSEKKEGVPAPETKWDQFDKLVIYTRKGVCARSKV